MSPSYARVAYYPIRGAKAIEVTTSTTISTTTTVSTKTTISTTTEKFTTTTTAPALQKLVEEDEYDEDYDEVQFCAIEMQHQCLHKN